MFAEHLRRFVLLISHIADVLNTREDHRALRRRFEDELEDHLSHEAAAATINSMIAWSRHAELFTYDSRTRTCANPKPLSAIQMSAETGKGDKLLDIDFIGAAGFGIGEVGEPFEFGGKFGEGLQKLFSTSLI